MSKDTRGNRLFSLLLDDINDIIENYKISIVNYQLVLEQKLID